MGYWCLWILKWFIGMEKAGDIEPFFRKVASYLRMEDGKGRLTLSCGHAVVFHREITPKKIKAREQRCMRCEMGSRKRGLVRRFKINYERIQRETGIVDGDLRWDGVNGRWFYYQPRMDSGVYIHEPETAPGERLFIDGEYWMVFRESEPQEDRWR